MKRQIITWGMMLAAAFTLTNCAKEIENPTQEPETTGYPFEIVASTVDTKTANDGLLTKWVAEDQINLFHAVCDGKDYKDDGPFTINVVEEGRFTGELSETLDPQEEYDWYAFYPYKSQITSPVNTSGWAYIGNRYGVSQTGYGDKGHLSGTNCPLYGIATAVPAASTPSIEMNHLSSVVAINVTNNTDEDLTINNAILTANEPIVGSFYIDFSGNPTYTISDADYVSNEAKVNVSEGTALIKGGTAVLYLVVKPFVAVKDSELSISVNGYEKSLKMPSDVTFTAGKIKTLNFSYDKKDTKEYPTLPWSEDFSEKTLDDYSYTNGGGTTSIYTSGTAYAGGEVPELMIAKNGGTFTAEIDVNGYVGHLTLSYGTNDDSRISVTSSTEGVTVEKSDVQEYIITIPEGDTDLLSITFTNIHDSSNVRLDDIELVEGAVLKQTLYFEEEALSFDLGSPEVTEFSGLLVQGAQTTVTYSSSNTAVANVNATTGAVTLGSVAGTATITATAEATSEYKEGSAQYEITLIDPSAASKVYTLTITKDDFNTSSYAANNNEKTSTAVATDGTTMDVKWTSYQVMQQNSTMQWQKSKGYIYNSTDLGTITDITVTSTGGSFTEYIGSSKQPSSTGTGGYFQIKVGSKTGYVTSIEITFEK